MPHVSEDLLARYALDPSFCDHDEVEKHISACVDCRLTLDRIRDFDEGLADGDSWRGFDDETPSRSREMLLAFAEAVATEDGEAKRLLAEFETAPAARLVWANLPSKPAYRTGGVVRLLSKRANAMCDRDPRHALALAETAIAIASLLSKDNYPAPALHDWRGETWKEQANALYCLGRFDDALEALTRAKGEYDQLPHAGIGHVAVTYVQALVLYEQEDFSSSEILAEISARAAAHLGSIDRLMAAKTLRGNIAFRRGDFRQTKCQACPWTRMSGMSPVTPTCALTPSTPLTPSTLLTLRLSM
jgi:tetratricopeptide (TPR) repeat protein